MNATMVVPPIPKTAANQVVYLWPGFKATQPNIGRPVLQPVLQYGRVGPKWELQSWAVGIAWGSRTGPAIPVSEGDTLTTYIELSADNIWTIYGKNVNTGQETVLRIPYRQATMLKQKYTNAVFVSENIMPRDHCDYYPANTGIEFKDIVVNSKKDHGTQWVAAYDCGSPDCGQKVISSNDGTSVQLTWNPNDALV